jgi:hypothetical protein
LISESGRVRLGLDACAHHMIDDDRHPIHQHVLETTDSSAGCWPVIALAAITSIQLYGTAWIGVLRRSRVDVLFAPGDARGAGAGNSEGMRI